MKNKEFHENTNRDQNCTYCKSSEHREVKPNEDYHRLENIHNLDLSEWRPCLKIDVFLLGFSNCCLVFTNRSKIFDLETLHCETFVVQWPISTEVSLLRIHSVVVSTIQFFRRASNSTDKNSREISKLLSEVDSIPVRREKFFLSIFSHRLNVRLCRTTIAILASLTVDHEKHLANS